MSLAMFSETLTVLLSESVSLLVAKLKSSKFKEPDCTGCQYIDIYVCIYMYVCMYVCVS